MTNNRITNLFKIKYPIIQGGMIWCAGWELASAVSNSGGLGLIGAGSMHPKTLLEHITKAKAATKNPFGVNIPLLYPDTERIMEIIVEQNIPIVFTSAGNPKTWTKFLQDKGIIVAHVVSNSKFAAKADAAGVDAIVAEGFEAGGHNGREETTTLALIPSVRRVSAKPLIAAGGIATGRQMLASLILGADAVQIGSAFAASEESSAHLNFKKEIIKAQEGSTRLSLKQIVPVRLIRNKFGLEVEKAELEGASKEDLLALLAHGRAKKGMFEGDTEEGELEIGQVASLLHKIEPVENIIDDIILAYRVARAQITHPKFDF